MQDHLVRAQFERCGPRQSRRRARRVPPSTGRVFHDDFPSGGERLEDRPSARGSHHRGSAGGVGSAVLIRLAIWLQAGDAPRPPHCDSFGCSEPAPTTARAPRRQRGQAVEARISGHAYFARRAEHFPAFRLRRPARIRGRACFARGRGGGGEEEEEEGGGMAPIVSSIEIARPPEDVFAYVTDRRSSRE
jgi:hypothetical protein